MKSDQEKLNEILARLNRYIDVTNSHGLAVNPNEIKELIMQAYIVGVDRWEENIDEKIDTHFKTIYKRADAVGPVAPKRITEERLLALEQEVSVLNGKFIGTVMGVVFLSILVVFVYVWGAI